MLKDTDEPVAVLHTELGFSIDLMTPLSSEELARVRRSFAEANERAKKLRAESALDSMKQWAAELGSWADEIADAMRSPRGQAFLNLNKEEIAKLHAKLLAVYREAVATTGNVDEAIEAALKKACDDHSAKAQRNLEAQWKDFLQRYSDPAKIADGLLSCLRHKVEHLAKGFAAKNGCSVPHLVGRAEGKMREFPTEEHDRIHEEFRRRVNGLPTGAVDRSKNAQEIRDIVAGEFLWYAAPAPN